MSFYGYIGNRNELMNLYRESDIFIMPSFTETFGVTYIEAMSQGLPVIYSRTEGIDGLFNNGEVGFAVNPLDVRGIVNKIENIYANYEEISMNCAKISESFSWDNIVEKYIDQCLL